METAFPSIQKLLFALACCLLAIPAVARAADDDPYREFEKIDSPEAIAWIEKENAGTLEAFTSDPRYKEFYEYIFKQLNADDRIIYPSMYRDSDIVRHFWRDEEHPQGFLRETTVDRFLSGDYQWRTLLDIDALSKAEGKLWVFKGNTYPYKNTENVMIALSDGGKDAVEYREYNAVANSFVEGGFALPESKSDVAWLDTDTLLVATSMTEEEQTTSGYPRVVREWKRGTPYESSRPVFSVKKEDMTTGTGRVEIEPGVVHTLFFRVIDFQNSETYRYQDGETVKFLIPDDSQLLTVHKGLAFVGLRSDWTVGDRAFKQGSIVYFPYAQITHEAKDAKLFYEPTANSAWSDFDDTYGYIYLTILEDVHTRITQYELNGEEWTTRDLPVTPLSDASIANAPADKGFILFSDAGFLTPTKLYRLDEKSFEKKEIQSLPERFDPAGYVVEQHFAESLDKTKVPYFIVRRKDMPVNGDNPVLQYAYGGFEITMSPFYSPATEFCWLRHGGVYVLANIRGGGEYGPSWHQQAAGVGRHKGFEDFIAVSEDLVKRGITSPARLGMQGASNGGLLTGSIFVLRPDLYNAAVIGVPLLDMLRYHLLPPGASWIAEYGDPEKPEVAEFWARYSPYQNLKKDTTYPTPFIVTSMKDDRVHPGHARKFAKRLEEYGKQFYYYEDMEGGHSGASNFDQVARTSALEWVYLSKRLMP